MQALGEQIDHFVATYLEPVKVWARGISAEDLEHLPQTLAALEQASAVISTRVSEEGVLADKERWRDILEQINRRVPNILEHVTLIRDQIRKTIDGVAKGQRGIAGYQRAAEKKSGIFERDA